MGIESGEPAEHRRWSRVEFTEPEVTVSDTDRMLEHA